MSLEEVSLYKVCLFIFILSIRKIYRMTVTGTISKQATRLEMETDLILVDILHRGRYLNPYMYVFMAIGSNSRWHMDLIKSMD